MRDGKQRQLKPRNKTAIHTPLSSFDLIEAISQLSLSKKDAASDRRYFALITQYANNILESCKPALQDYEHIDQAKVDHVFAT